MSKRKASNSVLTINRVMNDINTWLVDKDCDLDEVEGDLDDLCGQLDEENENNSDPTQQFILEEEVTQNNAGGEKQPLNPRQQKAPRKHLTCNRKVHDRLKLPMQ